MQFHFLMNMIRISVLRSLLLSSNKLCLPKEHFFFLMVVSLSSVHHLIKTDIFQVFVRETKTRMFLAKVRLVFLPFLRLSLNKSLITSESHFCSRKATVTVLTVPPLLSFTSFLLLRENDCTFCQKAFYFFWKFRVWCGAEAVWCNMWEMHTASHLFVLCQEPSEASWWLN